MCSNFDRKLPNKRISMFDRLFGRARTAVVWVACLAIFAGLGFAGEHLILNKHSVSYEPVSDVAGNQTGPGNPAMKSQSKSNTAQNRPKGWGITVPADLKIGSLQLGDPLNNAVKYYGQPKQKTTSHGTGTPEWIYPGELVIDGDPIWQITVCSASVGSTPCGIHVGSPLSALQDAYSGFQKHSNLGGELFLSLNYDNNLFILAFTVKKGVVSQINITKNLPPF